MSGRRVDTALGWRTGQGAFVSRTIRIVLCVAAVAVFTGPLITIVSGAFDVSVDLRTCRKCHHIQSDQAPLPEPPP